MAVDRPAGSECSSERIGHFFRRQATYLSTGFASYTRWGDFLVALNSNAPWHNPALPGRFPGAP